MKPEPDAEAITVGPNTRVTFMGVALVSLLVGLCVGTWTIGVGLERFNRNMEDRMTHDEMFEWTMGARSKVPELPLYVPPKRKD